MGSSLVVLGDIAVETVTGRTTIASAQSRAAIARLVVGRAEPTSADALVEAVWGEPVAEGAVRVMLTRTRSALAVLEPSPSIVRTPAGLRLQLQGSVLDLDRFESAAAAAANASDPTAAERLSRSALQVWATPFAEFADRDWAAPTVARLTDIAKATRRRLAFALMSMARFEDALTEWRTAADADPFDEDVAVQLALCLARLGRNADGLRVLADLNARMSSELGLRVSTQTREVERQLLDGSSSAAAPIGLLGANPEMVPEPQQARVRMPTIFGTSKALAGRSLVGSPMISAVDPPSLLTVLVGPAGIGKTMQASAFGRAREQLGDRLVVGRFDPEGSAGLLPLRLLAPELPIEQIPNELDARLHLAASIAASIRGTRTTLLLDDLHWAGEDALIVLRALLAEVPDELRVVATHRSKRGAGGDELAPLLARLVRDGVADVVEISTLSATEIRELIELTAPGLAPAEVDDLVTAADGVPLFALELAALRVREPNARDIPPTLRALFAERSDRLEPGVRQALAAGAILGRSFESAAVASMLGLDDDDVIEHFEAAAVVGIVVDAETVDGFAFVHDLVREHTLATVSSSRRLRLHAAAAETLEALRSDNETFAVRIARHLLSSHLAKTARTAFAAYLAAEELLAASAYGEAAYLAAASAEILRTANGAPAELVRTLLVQGVAQTHSGALDAAAVVFEEAFRIASDNELAPLLVEAAIGWTGAWASGAVDHASKIAALDAAAGGSIDTVSRYRVLVKAAVLASLVPGPRRTLGADHVSEAFAVAERLNEPVLRREAALADCALQLGSPTAERRRRLALAALDAISDVDRFRYSLSTALSHLVVASWELGDDDAVDRWLAQLRDHAEQVRRPIAQFRVAYLRASILLGRGSLVEGGAAAREARDVGARMGLRDAQVTYALQTFDRRRREGRLAEMASSMRPVVDVEQDVLWECCGVLTLLEAGEDESALQILERVEARIDTVPHYVRGGVWFVLADCLRRVEVPFLRDRVRRELAAFSTLRLSVAEGALLLDRADHALRPLLA